MELRGLSGVWAGFFLQVNLAGGPVLVAELRRCSCI